MAFADRQDAGRRLAEALENYRGRNDLIVLGLPRGGVPVAEMVAKELGAALDVILVRKLGVPGQEELAMGAIADNDAIVLNEALVSSLGVDEGTIGAVRAQESRVLARRAEAYRAGRAAPDLSGRCVILVDDGMATGATAMVAVEAVRRQRPKEVVVACPVAPPETVERLRTVADDVVTVETRTPFFGVGYWYREFAQTDDSVVQEILRRAWRA